LNTPYHIGDIAWYYIWTEYKWGYNVRFNKVYKLNPIIIILLILHNIWNIGITPTVEINVNDVVNNCLNRFINITLCKVAHVLLKFN